MERSTGYHPRDSDEAYEAASRATLAWKDRYLNLCKEAGEEPLRMEIFCITQEEEEHYEALIEKLRRLEVDALAGELGITVSPDGNSKLILAHLKALKKNEVNMHNDTVDTVNEMPEDFWKTDKAVKHDNAKDRMEFIPALALRYVSKAFTHGAEKYGKFNYLKGMEWSRLIGAAHRHINATELRIDYDSGEKGSGLLHTAHAVASLMMLLEYQLREIGEDDRAGMDGFVKALEKMDIE